MDNPTNTWEACYLPPDPLIWQGHAEHSPSSCFSEHIQFLNLLHDQAPTNESPAFVLLGFKSDEGIARELGRTGAFEGPVAIRQKLAKLPLQKPDIICYDAGNIVCAKHDLEKSQEALAAVVTKLIQLNLVPIVLGGGHELAWGHFRGITNSFVDQKRLGIINFDAHLDMRAMGKGEKASASTAFYQIAVELQKLKRPFDYNCIGVQHAGNVREAFETAKQYKANIILADDLHQGLKEKCFDFVDRIIDENDIIYLSLSLDVFSAASAPGVSAIQPLGLDPWHLIPLVRQAAASTKVVSYDIVELVPRYDIDHRTAKLAATLVYEIIHHHAFATKTS